ncbi:MAG: DegT/DnrJ/EryC1/StrS family aminotransferase [Planctomycetota bacterium]|jgi:perosamine synthetase
MEKIPVSSSDLRGNEENYLVDCIATNWVSSQGRYVFEFESKFSQYINVNYSLACSSGTTALHLALLGLDIEEGAEVIVPSFTFAATVNSILYCDAKPVFVDIDPITWCLDPVDVKAKLSAKTKAIMVVHLYGNPANMDKLQKIAKASGLFLIEDCAEALGVKYDGKHVGSFGDVCCHSFYGNKTITCGEGGMVSTNSETICNKIRLLRDQGMVPEKRYYHKMLAYNYRMTNLQAAVGLAQLERMDHFLKERLRVSDKYFEFLKEVDGITLPFAGDSVRKPVSWLFTILLKNGDRNELARHLREHSIDTRPVFHPIHKMPYISDNSFLPITDTVSDSGISLPTYTQLTNEQIKYICNVLKKCIA